MNDTQRLDWLGAWRAGDVGICPPGEHGGRPEHWLVYREYLDKRGIHTADEWTGPTLRDAIDKAME